MIYNQGFAAGIDSLGQPLPSNLANTCIGPDGECDVIVVMVPARMQG